MLAVTLRGLADRKLRTVLTSIAVVLGVALIAGTYILTDTINNSFDNIFSTASKGTAAVVTPREAIADTGGGTVDPALVAKVRGVPGVRQAVGGIFDGAQIFDKQDESLSTGGAPAFVSSTSPPPINPFNFISGHPPRNAHEAALDETTASKGHYRVGDTVRIAGTGRQRSFTVSGIAKFGDVSSLGGAALAVLTLPEAKQILGKRGYDTINITSDPGLSDAQLAQRVRSVLPQSVVVRTGSQQASKNSSDIRQGLSFLTTILLVFGGIALFVGAFIIFNTFSITVAQRMREFALLRMIGASRRQVLRAVIGEAALIGVLASVVGLALGFALAPGLRALFKTIGADLPSSGMVFEARTAIVALAVGILVTLAATIAPALRATRVAPMAALQESAAPARPRRRRLRTALAASIALIGIALMVIGLFGGASGSSAAALIGAGAGVVFIGVGLLASRIVRPLSALIGAPLERLRGVSGQLARENAMRNPGRTASTAAALMIGVALVAFVAIFAAGIKSSVASAVDNNYRGALVIEGSGGGNGGGQVPLQPAASAAVARVPGVAQVSPLNFAKAKVRGVDGTPAVTGVQGASFSKLYRVDWKSGSVAALRRLAPGQVLVSDSWRDKAHVKVGSRLSVLTPTGARVPMTVRGVYQDKGQLLGDLTVPRSVTRNQFGVRQDALAAVGLRPGADVAAVQQRIKAALDQGFPTTKVLTKQEFKDDQASQVDQVLTLFYVLLSLSVIVSLFGIVNTLALSIHERTRELGMFRAIGASRRQVRIVIRYESVITAMIGAVLGVVLGIIFAILVTQPLADEGFILSFPVPTLIALLVLAAIAGVLAAIGPARRASRLDVLRALQYE